jgi:hypothetical protein
VDTEDGHRLRVTRVLGGRVYFTDLDGANPARQWGWLRASFLERAAPAGGDPSGAEVAAPLPEQEPVDGAA